MLSLNYFKIAITRVSNPRLTKGTFFGLAGAMSLFFFGGKGDGNERVEDLVSD